MLMAMCLQFINTFILSEIVDMVKSTEINASRNSAEDESSNENEEDMRERISIDKVNYFDNWTAAWTRGTGVCKKSWIFIFSKIPISPYARYLLPL